MPTLADALSTLLHVAKPTIFTCRKVGICTSSIERIGPTGNMTSMHMHVHVCVYMHL